MLITQWLSMSSDVESTVPIRQASGPHLSDSGTPRRASIRSRRQTLESWQPDFGSAITKVEPPAPIRSMAYKQDAETLYFDVR